MIASGITVAAAISFSFLPGAALAQDNAATQETTEAASTDGDKASKKDKKKDKKAKAAKSMEGDDKPSVVKTKGTDGALEQSDPAEPEIHANKKDEGKKEEGAKNQDPSRPFNPAAVRDYNQGVELQQQGFLNQAIQKYKSAIDADDRLEQAFCNLGLIYIAQRNFAKASDAFKKAIVLKPSNPFSLNGMGSVLYSKGKVAEAMEKWQKAIEVDQNFYSAYFNMANAWKNEKDLQKALENYVLTIKTNPNMADAYYEVGLIFAKQRHAAQAVCMLNKAMQLQPDGEFVAEAKKQVTALDSLMGKDDPADGEVKMNIVAPAPKEENTDETSK
jgi:tetratricopeptide (TPR) repeat protein